jgi:hypothetical protein
MFWIKYFCGEKLEHTEFNDYNAAEEFVKNYLKEDDIFDSNF